ncbi:MAG: hypothetical protein V2J62_09885, partial [candidate division KSB1 bacterium]|nr:hypothetical protein [candidate division KSB1 bacterium]
MQVKIYLVFGIFAIIFILLAICVTSAAELYDPDEKTDDAFYKTDYSPDSDYSVRLEVDPYDTWEDFTFRIENNSATVTITTVTLTGSDGSTFDRFKTGNFTVSPDVGRNNDGVTSQQVTLTFNSGGLAPGATDNNGTGSDLDWSSPKSMTAVVEYADGAQLSGAVVNVGDSDDNNSDLWVFESDAPGPPAATLTMISPNGGESWDASSTRTVQWSSDNFSGNVKLEVSIDNGSNYTTIVASTADDGSHAWTLPEVSTGSALVRVSDASDGDPSDVSDGVFSIISSVPGIAVAPSSLTFSAQEGGANPANQSVTITN